MLYEKTNENNSLLEELKSFCLALILVSSLFYIGLNSFHFDHSGNTFATVEKVEILGHPVLSDLVNTEIEICRDLIVDNNLSNKTKLLPTINTQIPIVKSTKRLTKKLKIKDPVSFTPPTGLSSSFKSLIKPVKKIQTPVSVKPEPILGVSKPYTLDNSISETNSLNCNNKIANSSNLCKNKKITTCVFDHIPTNQTKWLMASSKSN